MPIAFGDHVLDSERRELRRGGECVAVEPQVFDLIAYLIENRDRVVGRDELIATVWRGRIVSESALASRINAARKAIGDDGAAQRLIRTYQRKGIRFIGSVTESPDSQVEGVPSEATAPPRPARGKPALAVLPFVNLDEDRGQQYFSDGITEDIITELTRNRSLRVIARNSSFAFRGQAMDLRDIGRSLGADYILQGSARRCGIRVRVSVQLADAHDGRQLWAERYDRELQDIFDVQDDIAHTIAARLDPEVGLAEQDRAQRKPRQLLEAWDFFRLGTRTFYETSAEANREAQALFRRAIEADPGLAQAYGFLSYSTVLSMVYFDAEPSNDVLAEAVAIGKRGVALDERDALTRFMYGRALLASGAYAQAVEQLQIALDLNASLAAAHCGLADSLACAGRVGDAMPYFENAITLSPHDPLRWAFLSYRALAHIFAREFEDAVQWSGKATLVPHCHYLAFAHRVAALGHLDDAEARRDAYDQLLRQQPAFTLRLARRRLFYVKNPDQLDIYLEGLGRAGVPP